MKILTKLYERKKDIWLKSPFVKKSKKQALRISNTSNHWFCFETQQGGNLSDFVKALAKVNITPAKPKRNSEWQPIETMPKDGTVVLGYYHAEDWVCEMSFAPEENKIYAGIDSEYKYVNVDNFSHWMPMPPAPTKSK